MKSFIKIFFPLACFFLLTSVGWPQEQTGPSKNEKEPPRANILIVNATTVPSLSLKIAGQEMYDDFRPGEKTSGGTFEHLEAPYEVTDSASKVAYSEVVKVVPGTFQSLVIMGDFKDIEKGSSGIRGLNQTPLPYKNVAFLLLNNSLEKDENPYRYRFVNAVSGKTIVCKLKGQEGVSIEPGQMYSYPGQKLQADFIVQEGAIELPLKLRQENPVHNVTFVIYEVDKKLRYVVIPEETLETTRDRHE